MTSATVSRKLLGELLVERGLLPEDDLQKALQLQRERKGRLGKVLLDLGYISQVDLLTVLSEQLGIPLVDPAELKDVPMEASVLPSGFLSQFLVYPYRVEGDTVFIAMADPLDSDTLRVSEQLLGRKVEVRLASEAAILKALDVWLDMGPADEGVVQAESDGPAGVTDVEAADIEQLRDLASEAPVIRWVNQLVARALERRSSDIHFEPFEKQFRVRYRIDGVLYEVPAPPRELQAAVTSRIKLMARLNIAEQRLPQDGRIPLRVLGREIDLRVSTLPTLYGESVVMRLLDRSQSDRYSLATLGFPDTLLRKMEYYLDLPHGLFLVTGPTGSGKSTTLYGSLRRLNTMDVKIITVEDPVEYQLPGVNQIHVNSQIGLTFAAGLRHIVRQDPDIIMIGEIRDLETAEIAMRAALTGHLVFSTLHTNDAPSAVTRLTDMGVEHYLVSSSLVAVLAQRLVRVLCDECKRPYPADTDDLRKQGWETGGPLTLYKAGECARCGHTGFLGRVGIFEFMEMEEGIRRAIVSRADASTLRVAARERGMRSLREDGWLKVASGQTTLEEVLRVTQEV
ncbi:Type II secretion system protein E [Acidobacteriia bacterium SbA2]|nr:Type II secretion system protein E [Acidobacteriia bacterium SbA2]